jgi:hypothetical protein
MHVDTRLLVLMHVDTRRLLVLMHVDTRHVKEAPTKTGICLVLFSVHVSSYTVAILTNRTH